MTTAPWPCSECGAPGIRNVYARGYCTPHLADLYRRLNPAVWLCNGIGLPAGPRPDHGDGYHNLQCVACEATWVGATFERCPWCLKALEQLTQPQRPR
jgi:hypothetical protein